MYLKKNYYNFNKRELKYHKTLPTKVQMIENILFNIKLINKIDFHLQYYKPDTFQLLD